MAPRSTAILAAAAIGWAAAAHLVAGMAALGAISFAVLVAAAGIGLGYEMEAGPAVALFGALALGGLAISCWWALSGLPHPETGVLFGTLPALVCALGAQIGGGIKEARTWTT
jgi:hypothetical protein